MSRSASSHSDEDSLVWLACMPEHGGKQPLSNVLAEMLSRPFREGNIPYTSWSYLRCVIIQASANVTVSVSWDLLSKMTKIYKVYLNTQVTDADNNWCCYGYIGSLVPTNSSELSLIRKWNCQCVCVCFQLGDKQKKPTTFFLIAGNTEANQQQKKLYSWFKHPTMRQQW